MARFFCASKKHLRAISPAPPRSSKAPRARSQSEFGAPDAVDHGDSTDNTVGHYGVYAPEPIIKPAKGEISERRVPVRYAPVEAAFDAAVREHRGAPTCATLFHRGEEVADLYAGRTQRGSKFSDGDVTTTQSLSKVVTGLAIAILEDRGLLSYDAPIATYWPEFAQNGKENITVAELLSHTAGLYRFSERRAWRRRPGLAFFRDREAVGNFLEVQKPERRGEIVYSAVTVGLYASQIIKRVDPKGRYLAEFCQEEIFEPLGISAIATMGMASEQIKRRYTRHSLNVSSAVRLGVPAQCQPCCLPGSRPVKDADRARYLKAVNRKSEFFQSINAQSLRTVLAPTVFDFEDWLDHENGSATLISNSSALAKIANELAMGGGCLLSAPALSRATQLAAEGHDRTFDVPAAFTKCGWSPLGRFSEKALVRQAAADGMFGWWGVGGQLVQFSVARQVGFAFMTTHTSLHIGTSIPAFDVLDAALRCLPQKQA